MKKFNEVIKKEQTLKAIISLNIFMGEVSKSEKSYENHEINYIHSSRYQTNILFMQAYFKPISRLSSKKFKNARNNIQK
jgi:hypothetical protein